jgi:[protein-PII] uridylyltransferase
MGGMVTRAELKSYLDGLKTSFLENPGTTGIEKTISAKIDDIILGFWHDREPPKSFALLAIGGYGRGTIHPESDIDLLFFFKDDIDEEAIKTVLHPLWGLQFKVGHQIRNADDFKQFDESHMESYTAFLDCRFLVGDAALAEEFEQEIFHGMIEANRRRFLQALVDMKATRYKQFGEPDIK